MSTLRRVVLTDKNVVALKPVKGKRVDVYDALMPKLLLRVTDSGSKTYMFRAYFPGVKGASRRELGKPGAMTVEQARTKAGQWHLLLQQKIDPWVEEQRQAELAELARLRALRAESNTFEAVALAYFAYTRSAGRKKAKVIEREIRKEFWHLAARPIHDTADIAVETRLVINNAVARGSLSQAHTLLERMKSLYNWALGTQAYGLTAPQVAEITGMRAEALIGSKQPRQRHLSDDELRALWTAISELEYPWKPLYQMLVLTGARLSDISNASWPEFDLNAKVFVIPASRFKGGKVTQTIPLTREMLAILNGLPRFKSGDYLFSADYGRTPVKGFSKPKLKLDARMPAGTEPWVIHDIRRSVRSHFSALPVEETVREVTIGHVLHGMAKTYNRYSYLNEKRHCLVLWQKRLTKILNPPAKRAPLPDNVLPMRKRR